MSIRLILVTTATLTATPSPTPTLTGTPTSTVTSTPTPTVSPTPTPTPTVMGTPPAHANLILWLVVGGIIAAGLVVILGRSLIKSGQGGPAASVIRSWIAISLVMGLLIFCAAALLGSDTSLQSILFGGLIASTGAAIAFYFSSQGADKARADILNAVTTIGQGGAKPSAFSQAAPPNGKVNLQYGPYKLIADGSPAPTYWVVNGKLPDGLALDNDGTLHGVPTTADTFTFAVAATNPSGLLRSPDLTVTVAAA
jgi:Putative Ig domain